MPQFQGSGFSIELPDGAMDASSYCFAFPQLGDFSPNITIHFERAGSPPDLRQVLDLRHQSLRAGIDTFRVISEGAYKWGEWDYVVSIAEWGPEGSPIRQKHVLLFITEAKPTLFSITATDLAENFARSEAALDSIIGSFKPNGVQVF